MFEGWANFFLLIGGASGSLIGLLFIVATLSAGRDREQTMQGTAMYTTPTVVKLAVVLTLSGAAMAPGLGASLAGLMLAGVGVAGLIYGGRIIRLFRRRTLGEPAHWSDLWCYAAAPMTLYAALIGAGALVWLDRPAAAPACAVVLMLMLLMAIRNAWDLVTWLAPRASPPAATSEASPSLPSSPLIP